jgi:2-polyprenyl-3-methyl-5-hydroxy-6-metoxy-1,4-benzoquinol methylase
MNERKSVAIHIPEGRNKVLDIGCGAGRFGEYLKNNNKAALVYGVELIEEAAKEASARLDNVICENLDSVDFEDLYYRWGKEKFDFITFNDVLEHTKDPWRILSSFRKFLNPEGSVIISIPNIRHWSVLYGLIIEGDWLYKDSGIMDKTHLRFFTKKSLLRLINSSGLKGVKVVPLMGRRSKILSYLTFGLSTEFLAEQYICQAKIE